MYIPRNPEESTLYCNESTPDGEFIEDKVRRIIENQEPITDASPRIYTERSEGVVPEYDIRTDRWDMAIDAMNDLTTQALQARADRNKRDEKTTTEPTGNTISEG